MKEKVYTDLICKGFCKYYKEGKEELHCNGYVFLRNNLTSHELKDLLSLKGGKISSMHKTPQLSTSNVSSLSQKELIDYLCTDCDFFSDGCDFAENCSGSPCGGYIIVNLLFG